MYSSLPIFATNEFAELTGLQIIQAKVNQEGTSDFRPRLVGKWNDSCFESPGVGTFGGFFGLEKDCFDKNINDILKELGASHDGRAISLTLPSNHISQLCPERQVEVLRQLGATLLFNEINHAISIHEWDRNCLSRGNQKKLRQCHEKGLVLKRLSLYENEFDELYEILRINRENLGATVSMSISQIRKAFETFPEKYFAFGVYLDGQMVAGAICLESAPGNLYVYMWGDLLEFRKISPIVFLCDSLIEFGADHDFAYLDLGTSSIKGELMPGVARFKENLGAIAYEKASLNLALHL